jgi:(p)ppGpp synthase/HD superfamily hydrolase
VARLSDRVIRDTTAEVAAQVAERIVRQDLEKRLSDSGFEGIARQVVGEVAERLVKEEIERLKEKLR